jgi:thymidylate kinase
VKKTLYLLRKPIDHIDPSLFLPSESQGDVVFLDRSVMTSFPYKGGTVFSLENYESPNSLSYEDLVKKIFEADRTIVI